MSPALAVQGADLICCPPPAPTPTPAPARPQFIHLAPSRLPSLTSTSALRPPHRSLGYSHYCSPTLHPRVLLILYNPATPRFKQRPTSHPPHDTSSIDSPSLAPTLTSLHGYNRRGSSAQVFRNNHRATKLGASHFDRDAGCRAACCVLRPASSWSRW